MDSATDNDRPYVFISYARADRERVLEVVAALSGAGIVCWLDQHDIAGGANWGGSIAEAIEGCAALVLLSSRASLASRNVRQEIALAWQHEKPLLPLRLEATPIPSDVAYWLATAQWIEVLDYPVEAWLPKVAQALGGIAPPVARATPASAGSTDHVAQIPLPLTPTVGRATEIGEIVDLLRTTRLITLVGPGGTGKTRVAQEVALVARSEFAEGIVWVDLTPITDPHLVVPVIADSLGVSDTGKHPMLSTLSGAIGSRRLLLVLDNVEQVIDAAGDISNLLRHCSHLHILATSRIALRISAEHEYQIAPFSLPDPNTATQSLLQNDAVSLFVQRARAARPTFALTPANEEAIRAICHRLDGLPLALELAAARCTVLTPQALLARLERPLDILSGRTRDLPDRQRTMRDTIQWSYGLLAPDERRLFRLLSVFVGGWTLEMAETVVASLDAGIDVLTGLASLVDNSVVVRREQSFEPRFAMLATIREFAQEQLAAAGESSDAQAAHARAFAAYAEASDVSSEREGEFTVGMARLEAEIDNLRAAVAWATEHDAGLAYRFLFAMWYLWYTRGFGTEGSLYHRAVLDRWPTATPTDRMRALYQAGTLASWQGDVDEARALHEEELRLAEGAGDQAGVGWALFGLGRAAAFRGDIEAARGYYEPSVAIARDTGDSMLLDMAVGNVAAMYSLEGDHERALAANDEALTLARASGSDVSILARLLDRSEIVLESGGLDEARQLVAEALPLAVRLGDRRKTVDCVGHVGKIAALTDHPERAAQLIGWAMHRKYDLRYLLPVLAEDSQTMIAELRSWLGEESYSRLTSDGRSMTLDDVVALALAVLSQD